MGTSSSVVDSAVGGTELITSPSIDLVESEFKFLALAGVALQSKPVISAQRSTVAIHFGQDWIDRQQT